MYLFEFLFNDTATTEIYTYLHTLSLHDALPIYSCRSKGSFEMFEKTLGMPSGATSTRPRISASSAVGVSLMIDAILRSTASAMRADVSMCSTAQSRSIYPACCSPELRSEIGRASCRERVCQEV